MKKLLILAASAFTIVGAQAASVQWASVLGSGKNSFLVDSSGAQIGPTDYASLGKSIILVALTGADVTSYQAGTYSATYDSSKVLSTGTIATGTKTSVKGSFNTAWKFTYNSENTSQNPIKDGNVLAVLITDGKTMSNISYSDSSLGMNGKVVDSLTVTGLAKDEDLYTDTFNFATAGNFTAAVSGSSNTPEPTSAMLVLVGLCGLALKRKRA